MEKFAVGVSLKLRNVYEPLWMENFEVIGV